MLPDPKRKKSKFLEVLGKLPLKTILIVPFVVQVVSVVGLVGYLSWRNGQLAIDDLASQLQTEISGRIRQHLDTYLETPKKLNEINLAAVKLGWLDLSDLEKSGRYFFQQMQFFNVGYISYGTTEGEYIGIERLDTGGFTVNEVTKKTGLKKLRVYETDQQGNRTKFLHTLDWDPHSEAWYSDAAKARKPLWSEIYQWEDKPEIISVAASHPVYQNNKFIGVISTDLILSQISSFLDQLKIGRTGKAFIIEANGLLVANSGKSPPIKVEKGQASRIKSWESTDRTIRLSSEFLMKELGKLEDVKTNRKFIFNIDQQTHYAIVMPWRDDLGLNWLVIVVIPQSDFMDNIEANSRITGLLCAIALVVAISLGIITSSWVTRPLTDLNEAAQDIAKGEWDKTVDIYRYDEVGELAQAFNLMAKQLEESFATLEDKVEERTAQLGEANQKIIALNAQLKQENLRLGTELNVARKIQEMLLPKTEELDNVADLDIAGFMQPADEVGGDYYDVLQNHGVVTIGIGDVTGHGLESGLLMLMTQTAVSTLQEIKETDPVSFLNALNSTIYRNVQRMNSDKNLTLAILSYSDSKVSITGQHEIIIIVRSNGEIELIDTIDLGFPIGLDRNITDFIGSITVELAQGDGMVLYTDGITEAIDLYNKPYGLERLSAVVKQNWSSAAKQIQIAVIDDVHQHIGEQKVFDDITLLVLKKT